MSQQPVKRSQGSARAPLALDVGILTLAVLLVLGLALVYLREPPSPSCCGDVDTTFLLQIDIALLSASSTEVSCADRKRCCVLGLIAPKIAAETAAACVRAAALEKEAAALTAAAEARRRELEYLDRMVEYIWKEHGHHVVARTAQSLRDILERSK